MPRPVVAIATATTWPDLDEDGPTLRAAFEQQGVDTVVAVWDDPTVDWAGFDLVLIRNTWDYWDRHADYLAWTRCVPRLVNIADVVAWNTDKAYLRELEAQGIPVVPTTWLEPGQDFHRPAGRFVIKPSISAGARDTAAYDAHDSAADGHVARLLAAGKTVMVQPYLEQVDTEGETAIVVFDGQVSHASRKSAVLTTGAGVPELGSWTMTPCEATPEQVALALKVTAGRDLAYARVDLLPTEQGPVLIELEVTEPSLFLLRAPGSADRLARAVAARLR